MLGDSDLFDAIMDISVTAARYAAPSLASHPRSGRLRLGKIGLRLNRFLSSVPVLQVYISGRSLCRNKLLMAALRTWHNELARIFHITTRTVYDIIRTESSKKHGKQLALPGMEQHETTKEDW